MEVGLITQGEKDFVLTYCNKIKELQNKETSDWTIYTKITMSYAILNNLCFINLLFHPQSLSRHRSAFVPEITIGDTKRIIEEIIVYEINAIRNSNLSSEELSKVIKHFEDLQKRSFKL